MVMMEGKMFPNHLLEDLATIYQQEQLDKARMARLAREIERGRPRMRDRFLSNSGDFMIVFGQKLKERYGPKIQPRATQLRPLP